MDPDENKQTEDNNSVDGEKTPNTMLTSELSRVCRSADMWEGLVGLGGGLRSLRATSAFLSACKSVLLLFTLLNARLARC